MTVILYISTGHVSFTGNILEIFIHAVYAKLGGCTSSMKGAHGKCVHVGVMCMNDVMTVTSTTIPGTIFISQMCIKYVNTSMGY